MGRIIIVYGLIGGAIVAAGMLLAINLVPTGGAAGMVAGYLSMLVALSTVFVGVRKYRDVEGGGVIRFWPAFGIGLAIAGVAGLAYVLAWEIYMYATDYTFARDYAAQYLADMRANGASAAAIAKASAEMEAFAVSYANPLIRMGFTFLEITPVGLLVSLVSAAVLRNPRALPATA
jgi:hypothetical protein